MSTLSGPNPRRAFLLCLSVVVSLFPLAFSRSAHAVSSTVVIDQVYTTGGLPGATWRNDYVVLFDCGMTGSGLLGWALQFRDAAGGNWSVFPLSGSIAHGRYFLVKFGSSGVGGGVLPIVEDLAFDGFNGTSSGTWALVNSTTPLGVPCSPQPTIVDQVGFGSPLACAEGGQAQAPTLTQSIRRNLSCGDSDQNGFDFALAPAAPQNSQDSNGCNNQPPVIDPIPDQAVLEGWQITHQVIATDPNGDPLTYSVTGPPWVSIDAVSGILTMAPPAGSATPDVPALIADVQVTDGFVTIGRTYVIRVLDRQISAAETVDLWWKTLPWNPMWSTGELSNAIVGGVSPEGDLGFRSYTRYWSGDETSTEVFSFIASSEPSTICWQNVPWPTNEVATYEVYSSILERDGITHGHFGRNWLGPFDWKLEVTGPIADVTTNRGGKIRFQNTGSTWELMGPLAIPYRLAQDGPDFLFFDATTTCICRYDATGRLTRLEDGHGYVLTCGYTGALLTSITDGMGRTLTYTYDASDRVISSSDGTRTVTYNYVAGNLASRDDAGGLIEYQYAAGPIEGLLTAVVRPMGNIPCVYSYGPAGEVVSVTDANANSWSFNYTRDPSGRVVQTVVGRPVPGNVTIESTLQGRWFRITDPAGGQTTRTFDVRDRVQSVMRPLGDVTTFGYNPANGHLASVLNTDGLSTSLTYASRLYSGLPLFEASSVTRRDGTVAGYAYDALGNLTSVTDPGAFLWGRTNNAIGQPLTLTNPSGGVTNFAYDVMGRLTSRTDPSGNTTTYGYDALHRLTTVTMPGPATRMYTYNALDQITSVTDELSKVHSLLYDANRRLVKVTNPLLQERTFTYDAMDRLIQETSPLLGQTNYAYDPVGRLQTVTDATGRSEAYAVNDVAKDGVYTDGSTNQWSFFFDANGRLTQESDPLSNSRTYAYDPMGRLTTRTNPVGSVYQYTHDAMGRLKTETGPLGYSRAYDYDTRGYLTRRAYGTSQVQYTRTPLGRRGSVMDANAQTWQFAYDLQGRRTSTTDPLARVVTYGYDARNRPILVGTPMGTLGLTYDAASRLTQRSYSDGTLLAYTYDDLGRLTATQGATFAYDPDGRIASANGIDYGRDAAGRVTSMTYAPGMVLAYQYDSRGLLAQVMDWVGGATTFQYDAAGRRTRMDRPEGSHTDYAYDAAGRLLSQNDFLAAQPGPVQYPITLARDARGRVTSALRQAPLHPTFQDETANHSYDAAGQITSPGFSYDGNGRLLTDGIRTYEWDLASRLKRTAAGVDTPRYGYDGLGRVIQRVKATDDDGDAFGDGFAGNHVVRRTSPATSYVYTPSGELLHGVDEATGARSFFHFDERGNTLYLTGNTGGVTTAYGYTRSGQFVDQVGLNQPHQSAFTLGGRAGVLQEGKSALYRAPGGGLYDGRTAGALDRTQMYAYPSTPDPDNTGWSEYTASRDGAWYKETREVDEDRSDDCATLRTRDTGEQCDGMELWGWYLRAASHRPGSQRPATIRSFGGTITPPSRIPSWQGPLPDVWFGNYQGPLPDVWFGNYQGPLPDVWFGNYQGPLPDYGGNGVFDPEGGFPAPRLSTTVPNTNTSSDWGFDYR